MEHNVPRLINTTMKSYCHYNFNQLSTLFPSLKNLEGCQMDTVMDDILHFLAGVIIKSPDGTVLYKFDFLFFQAGYVFVFKRTFDYEDQQEEDKEFEKIVKKLNEKEDVTKQENYDTDRNGHSAPTSMFHYQAPGPVSGQRNERAH